MSNGKQTRRSLILAGGGLKVAFQAGVLQVWLDEAGLRFDHVDGASGGVFNLAMLCQGLTGKQTADNWRRTDIVAGISVNLPRLDRLALGQSLFTLDGYRRHVFPGWGLDWNRIRASTLDATFNVYNFSRHRLEVLPPAAMTEDHLCACVSLPMWFPPTIIGGDTYIDGVFATDGNIEEAIRRGADEIWVIWTVSERGEWRDGFIANYFQIIEACANGQFHGICKRIDENNEAIAAGGRGEFGRRIDLRILRSEVPLHYLVNVSSDRLVEAVNLGVNRARAWCRQEGIPLVERSEDANAPTDVHTVVTKLQFTEEMKGYVTLGEADYERGARQGRTDGTRAMVHLTIGIDGVNRFVTNPQHEARADGYVESEVLGGRRPVERGVFNLLVDEERSSHKAMYYRLFFHDAQGNPLTLVGFKDVKNDPGSDEWEDTTTLFTRVLRGHVPLEEDGNAEIVAGGILRIHMLDFLHQLTTVHVEGPTLADRSAALGRFGGLFFGKLWDVYGSHALLGSGSG